MKMKILIIFSLFILNVFSHPDKNVKKREGLVCTPPKEYKDKTFVYPFPVSWHVHIVFVHSDLNQIELAKSIREKAKEKFKDYLKEDCEDRYENTKMCMIYDHNIEEPFGPFPSGEISMWFPNSHFNLVMNWFTQNRNGLSIVFHPNTGCEYEDHSDWAIWVGEPWKLNMSIFDKNTQTNEFDQFAGNDKNPTCVGVNEFCDSPDFNGVFITCCENLLCDCKFGERCKCKAIK